MIFTDFEESKLDFIGFDGASCEVVQNPTIDLINSSENVLSFTKGTISNVAGVHSDSLGGIVDLSIDTTFKMKVLSNSAGIINFRVDNFDDHSQGIEIIAEYNTPGEWAELVFDYSNGGMIHGTPGIDYGILVILPDVYPGEFINQSWWFDDIECPGFTSGNDIELTLNAYDYSNTYSKIEVEFSNNPGTKIELTKKNSETWSTIQSVPGNTFLNDYYYSIYLDDILSEEYSNMNISAFAGDPPSTINCYFGELNYKEANASYFKYDTPIIDGEIDAIWDTITSYRILRPFGLETFENKADLAGNFKIGWDETGLYVLVLCNDDYYYTEGDSGMEWEKDAIELYFDANIANLEDEEGPGNCENDGSNGHYWLYHINNRNAEFTEDWLSNSYYTRKFKLYAYGYRQNSLQEGDPYSIVSEHFIPWNLLRDKDSNPIVAEENLKFGFDIVLVDNDNNPSGGNRNRLIWQSDNTEPWYDMDNCGIVKLCDGPISKELYSDYDSIEITFSGDALNSFEVVDNPQISLKNLSQKVGLLTNSSNNDPGTGIISEGLGGHFDLSNDKEFRINLLTLNTGLITLRLEETSNSENYIEKSVDYTVPNVWTKLIFDMKKPDNMNGDPLASYDKYRIIPTGIAQQDYANSWWFDNLYGPDFISGEDVEFTVQVIDKGKHADKVEVEFSSDKGTMNQLQYDGDSSWTASNTIPGNTFKKSYHYTLYIDDVAIEGHTNSPIDILAGSEPKKITYTHITEAINNTTHNKYNIYPNPVSKNCFTISNAGQINSVSIYNVVGQQQDIEKYQEQDQITINTNNLDKGIYIVSIISKSGITNNQKIIIE